MNRINRLQFTDEEKAIPELSEYIENAERAAARAEELKSHIPKKKIQRIERRWDDEKGKAGYRLIFDEEEKMPSEIIKKEHRHIIAEQIIGAIHNKIHEVEKENSAVESVHKSELAAEHIIHDGRRAFHQIHNHQRLSPYREYNSAEKELEKANREYRHQKLLYENPQLKSNPISRHHQRQQMKERLADTGKKAGKSLKSFAVKVKEKLVVHRKEIMIISAVGLVSILMISLVFIAITLLAGGLSSVSGSTYLSEDEEIYKAEQDYILLEQQLIADIDNIEKTYPDYDEYNYSIDRIDHDPYVLASILSAIYTEYTSSEIQKTLKELFEYQYELILTEESETRYKTEQRTATYTNPDGTPYVYTYTVEVPYTYYILNVELINKNLATAAYEILDEEQLKMYEIYIRTHGNRPDLFT